jgi:hypothetical protein
MTLIIQKPTSGKLILAKTFYGFIADADARDYLTRVHAAEGQTLEPETCLAIEAFVTGCKADGIWTAIKASCILAGARTVAGALVPLVGTAPTNVGGLFVSGDYNRKTGLVGNGSSKYLDTNTAHNAAPQNNVHLSVYSQNNTVLNDGSSPLNFYAGAVSGSATSMGGGAGNSNTWIAHDINSSVPLFNNQSSIGFYGVRRNNASTYDYRIGSLTTTVSRSASGTAPGTGTVSIFARSGSFATLARLAFYSFGESLNLALLDTRVTDLINAFAAAIP